MTHPVHESIIVEQTMLKQLLRPVQKICDVDRGTTSHKIRTVQKMVQRLFLWKRTETMAY